MTLTLDTTRGRTGPEPLGGVGLSLECQRWFCGWDVIGNEREGDACEGPSLPLHSPGVGGGGHRQMEKPSGVRFYPGDLSSCSTSLSGKRFALLRRTPGMGLSLREFSRGSSQPCCLGRSAGAPEQEAVLSGCSRLGDRYVSKVRH